MKKPTTKQKLAFQKLTESVASGKPKTMGMVAKEAGYGKGIQRNPHILTDSVGFRQLMAQIDDSEILNRVKEIATDTSDKRACLAAADMIFKLKDRYPDKKIKIGAYDEREAVVDEVRQEQAEEADYYEAD